MEIVKMKAAVIGCGMISEFYLKNLKDRFRIIEVIGCSDLSEERMTARAQQFGIRAMTFEEILQTPEIELIINLTSPAVHYTITRQALEAKKHVYSEKPMAVKLEEAEELCRLADKNGVRLGVAPDTFLGASIQTARAVIDTGLIGKPLSFNASLTRDFGIIAEILPHMRKRGASLSMDTGCYYLTALAALFGPSESLFAYAKQEEAVRIDRRMGNPGYGEPYQTENEDIMTAAVRYQSGIIGTYHINAGTIFDENRILRIFGSKGILDIDDPNCFKSRVTLQKPFSDPITIPVSHGFEDNARGIGAVEMAWSIRKGRPHRASMEMGYHIIEMLSGMEKSAEKGMPYLLHSTFNVPPALPEGYIERECFGVWCPTEESALAE